MDWDMVGYELRNFSFIQGLREYHRQHLQEHHQPVEQLAKATKWVPKVGTVVMRKAEKGSTRFPLFVVAALSPTGEYFTENVGPDDTFMYRVDDFELWAPPDET